MQRYGKLLLVDDDELVLKSLSQYLLFKNYQVVSCSHAKEALEIIKQGGIEIVIADLKMPDMNGLDLLKCIKSSNPSIDVVILTSYASIDNAVKAMKFGATDYITKPIIDEEIQLVIRSIFERRKLKQENAVLKKELHSKRSSFREIIGQSDSMQRIYSLIESVSSTKATVLINGESGTGKGMVAQAIMSSDVFRCTKPFVEVSCGALPETLLESELFGHVKGAFTSAIRDRVGRFELADKGTIFLDEIDTLSPYLQVKLLRVLQDMEFERVGETQTMKVDVRVIAATNQDLEKLIEQGKFREDLYYRLNVIKINMPPLRERRSDIPLLCEHFLKVFSERFNKQIDSIRTDFYQNLFDSRLPGNVRELENIMERAVVLCQGTQLTSQDLPEQYTVQTKAININDPLEEIASITSLKNALREPEKRVIENALLATKGNRKEAARLLDINRTTLYNKMREYDLLDRV